MGFLKRLLHTLWYGKEKEPKVDEENPLSIREELEEMLLSISSLEEVIIVYNNDTAEEAEFAYQDIFLLLKETIKLINGFRVRRVIHTDFVYTLKQGVSIYDFFTVNHDTGTYENTDKIIKASLDVWYDYLSFTENMENTAMIDLSFTPIINEWIKVYRKLL